jgi:RNA polymerase sporulation-specific sigma factor
MTNEELAILIRQGRQEYIPQLYQQIEKFLRSKANSFYRKYLDRCSKSGVELCDLIQEGYFAMLDAIKWYKPETEYKFLTFLDYPILNHFNALAGLRTAGGRNEPLNNCTSLDEPVREDMEDVSLGDAVQDENSQIPFEEFEESECQKALHTALVHGMEELTAEQRTAIQCRYYEKKTYDQTGAIIGCSRERVRQHEAKALRVLRKPRIARTLIPFLYDEMEARAYRGTGLTSFRNTGMSATERTAERMDELEQRLSRSSPRSLKIKLRGRGTGGNPLFQ